MIGKLIVVVLAVAAVAVNACSSVSLISGFEFVTLRYWNGKIIILSFSRGVVPPVVSQPYHHVTRRILIRQLIWPPTQQHIHHVILRSLSQVAELLTRFLPVCRLHTSVQLAIQLLLLYQ